MMKGINDEGLDADAADAPDGGATAPFARMSDVVARRDRDD
jgi:hypothetical protein